MTTALIVSLAYWVLILVYRFFANSMADQPIFVGPIIGLLLGDVMTGVAIGAALQIIYLGVVNVGGAQSTDTLYATCMAVALCIATGIPEEAAITLGIALGYIGLVMLQVTRIFFAFCAPWLDKVAETGDRRKYDRAYLVHIIIGYGFGAVTMFIALAAGADATQTFVTVICNDRADDSCWLTSCNRTWCTSEHDVGKEEDHLFHPGICSCCLSECSNTLHGYYWSIPDAY